MSTRLDMAEEVLAAEPRDLARSAEAPQLSAIIIAKDEAHNLPDCLATLNWVHEIIVVVDETSNDNTAAVAREYTNKVFTRTWGGYALAKNFALAQATGEWVLSIDADERVTPELREEICALLTASPQCDGYEMPRLANFVGKWIMHGGWYPGYVLRLFRRDAGGFDNVAVHEAIQVQGNVGRLRHHLLHYTDPSIRHYFEKFNRYTALAAEEMQRRGKRFHVWDLLIRPSWFFFRMYILRTGFMDGLPGLMLATFSAAYVFTKYAKLWELERISAKG